MKKVIFGVLFLLVIIGYSGCKQNQGGAFNGTRTVTVNGSGS